MDLYLSLFSNKKLIYDYGTLNTLKSSLLNVRDVLIVLRNVYKKIKKTT